MARQDIRVKESALFPAHAYQTKAGNTPIKAGEWVIQGTSGDVEYVTGAANGSSNADIHVGVAVSNDTVGASTDGIVYVVDDPDAIGVIRPTTPANLLPAIKLTKVTLDIINGVQTIDEDDVTNGCFFILDYDAARNEVYFKIDKSYHINS